MLPAPLLALSIVFHAVVSLSIFDLWFRSPVLEVKERYASGALAKRVVLIVGDGLRADKLFQHYGSPPFVDSAPLPRRDAPHAPASSGFTTPAPFVRTLIERGASWGVSWARIPTESRPGHVAILGGQFEDVSAVTTGWQVNPILADSVLNQSSHAWSFGSPDILPMFKRGALPGKVDAWSYGHEMEDFTQDAVELDLWVLDQLRALFANSTSSPALAQQLNAEGSFFFLHLLSLDSTGHSYRPHGSEYHRAIRVFDYVVEQTVAAFAEYFGDDLTAFVLTSDHGMSAVGNHGDGSLDNTRCPLVVWGAGVQKGVPGVRGGNDEYSEGWGLNGVRLDVDQVDLAPLISVLAGNPIPANSAGRLPIDYLDATPAFKAEAALANAQQIVEQYTTASDLKQLHAVSFRPFDELVESQERGTKSLAAHLDDIERLMEVGEYERATERSMELVLIALRGLRYFQTYDWLLLQALVIAGYLGFSAIAIDFVLSALVYPGHPAAAVTSPSTSLLVQSSGFLAFSLVATKFFLERAPVTYYLYAFFPHAFWISTLINPWSFRLLFQAVRASPILPALLKFALGLATLQLIVVGYATRVVYTGMLLLLGAWPWLGTDQAFRTPNRLLLLGWTLSCVATSVYPALPVEKGESVLVICAGAAACVALGIVALSLLGEPAFASRGLPEATKSAPASPTTARARTLVKIEMALTAASMLITWSSSTRLQLKQGLPRLNQSAGWFVLVASCAIPIIHGRPRNQPPFERLSVLLLAFAPVFVILSLSYETLFYASFSSTLCLWLVLETRLVEHLETKSGKGKGKGKKVDEVVRIGSTHVRIALVFLVFLHVAFFGVGNVASISSFYLEPVFRLIPIFSPFPMALLLLLKLLIPFLVLSMVVTLLNARLRLPPFALFLTASAMAEVLTINFFLVVRDTGSWLEIGTSISHFAIASFLSIFNTALFLLGEFVCAHTA